MLFRNEIFGISIERKTDHIFWNPEAKLDKIACVGKRILCLEVLPYLTSPRTDLDLNSPLT